MSDGNRPRLQAATTKKEKQMKGTKRLSLALVGFGVATTLIGAGIAQADPVIPAGGHTYDRPVQGEGSDTTEGVMNGLSEVLTGAGGGKLIASYNALGTSGFETKNPLPAGATSCTYTGNPSPASSYVEGARANGSGNGVTALNDAWLNTNTAGTPKPTHLCLDFARASGVQGAKTVGMTYIPFAKDAVAFAVTNTSNLPRMLSKADLVAMYNCTYPGFNDAVITGGAVTTPSTYHALIPQAGSGTRKFWLAQLGISDPGTTVSAATACLSDRPTRVGLGGSTFIEEHKGNVLDDNSIVPISVAQYISQSEGVIADVRGRAVLGVVVDQDSTGVNPATQFSLPMAMNGTYGTIATNPVTLSRDVYNVVPTQVINRAPGDAYGDLIKSTFAGGSSKVCSAAGAAVILKYGFGTIGNCGDTSTVTAGQ